MYSTDENIRLHAELKADPTNKDLRHKVILVHRKLVQGMAYHFCKRKDIGHEVEEYECVGYLHLIIGVDNSLLFGTSERQDITRYLMIYIKRSFSRHFMSDRMLRIPVQTYHRHVRDGRADLIKTARIESTLGNITVGRLSDQELLLETMDMFPRLFDRQVLHLKMSGCTEGEIAVLLCCSPVEVKSSRDFMRRVFKASQED